MGTLDYTNGTWRSNAERCRAQRVARKQRDPDFLARERRRVAAVRAGQPSAPRQEAPAAPQAHEAPPVAPQDTAAPRTYPQGASRRVAAITDAWDARLHERRLRRAARRGAG